MELQFNPRSFYPDELRLLKALKTRKEKENRGKLKSRHFAIAGVLGAGFTYLATLVPDSFWTFLFGTAAVLLFSFLVFTPYEIYKMKTRQTNFLDQLDKTISKETVDTCLIQAKRIAIAREYEDEGDLYIVEYELNQVLYLWDYDRNLQKKFPCLEFEIYEENFYKLTGRQVYPLSTRIKPVEIDKNAKWSYMKKAGSPGHLQTDHKNFDKLLDEYNNV